MVIVLLVLYFLNEFRLAFRKFDCVLIGSAIIHRVNVPGRAIPKMKQKV